MAAALAAAAPSAADRTHRLAHRALTGVLAVLLGQGPAPVKAVLHDPEAVDRLMALLTDDRSRTFAMAQVVRLMKAHCATESERGAKRVLCARYLETMLGAQDRWRQRGSVALLVAMLGGVRDALRSDNAAQQALFKDVDCFVQIVSLLNEAYPHAEASVPSPSCAYSDPAVVFPGLRLGLVDGPLII